MAQETDIRQRRWIALAHFTPWVWLVAPFGHVVGPAAAWLLSRKRGAAVRDHALQALNFQLWGALAIIAAYVLLVLFSGFLVSSVIAIALLSTSSIAGVRAVRGRAFRYPFVPNSALAPAIAASIIAAAFAVAVAGAWKMDSGTVVLQEEWRPPSPEPFDPIQKVGDTDWLQYAELSRFVYSPDAKCAKCEPPREYESGWRWTSLVRAENSESGFYAQAFRYMDGTVVLAFRGTEPADWRDLLTDLAMGFGIRTRQFRDAEETFLRLRARFGPTIRLTGHSLGGSLAQYLGARYAADYAGSGKWSVAFNGFGVSRLAPELATQSPHVRDKVFNVTQSLDLVSSVSFPFTITGIVQDAWAFVRDEPMHHLGCRMSFPEQRQPWNVLKWHSVDQMHNDVMLYEFGSTDSTQIHRCPPPRPLI